MHGVEFLRFVEIAVGQVELVKHLTRKVLADREKVWRYLSSPHRYPPLFASHKERHLLTCYHVCLPGNQNTTGGRDSTTFFFKLFILKILRNIG